MPLDGAELDDLKTEIKSTYGELDKKTSDLGEIVAEIKKTIEQKGDASALEGRIAEVSAEVKRIAGLADGLDKKLARPGARGADEQKSAGRQFVEAEEVKSWLAERSAGKVRFEVKAAMTTPTQAPASALAQPVLTAPHRTELQALPQLPMMMRSIIPAGPTESNMIQYPRHTGRNHAAAVVAEGALKPESGVTFELIDQPVATIAHWIDQSKQLVDDAPRLAAVIDTELRYGLALAEEHQLINGDGSSGNLSGIVSLATAFNEARLPSDGSGTETLVDRVRFAKLQCMLDSAMPATAVLLNPADWAVIETLKDAQGNYIFSAFASGAEPRLWGLRVVECFSVPEGKFVVGSFALASRIWDRQGVEVEATRFSGDNFKRNLVTVLAEQRMAFEISYPKAFVLGNVEAA